MTLAAKIQEVGLPKTNKDSARRAVQKILDQSTGPIPRKDIAKIMVVLVEAIDAQA